MSAMECASDDDNQNLPDAGQGKEHIGETSGASDHESKSPNRTGMCFLFTFMLLIVFW